MMEVFVIAYDWDPAGDYLVTAARITGLDTEEEDVGRAETVEQAHAFLPPGLVSAEFYRGMSRTVEIWL